MKKLLRDIVIMFIGALIIGLGIEFTVQADLGADAMTSFENGLSISFNIPLPICTLIANGIFFILILIINRKKAGVATLLCPLCISLGIWLSEFVVKVPANYFIRIIYYLLGIILVGIGVAFGSFSQSGNNPYDGFVLAVSEKINKPYNILRSIGDICVMFTGLLLGVRIGVDTVIGTIIVLLVQGTVIQLFINLIKKMNIFG